MSIEQPNFKGEHKEREAALQASVDELFVALAPYHDDEEDAVEASDARYDVRCRAMSVLLSDQLRQRYGEDYNVSAGDDYFYLAQCLKLQRGRESDQIQVLGVLADASENLQTGKITILFDIIAKSSERDGLDKHFFDKPLEEDVKLELTASPDAMKRVYEKLESQYRQEVVNYENELAAFRVLVEWVKKRSDKNIDPVTWSEQPMLGDFWPTAEGAKAEIAVLPSDDSREKIQLVVFDHDGEQIRDILEKEEPLKPERWFKPSGDAAT